MTTGGLGIWGETPTEGGSDRNVFYYFVVFPTRAVREKGSKTENMNDKSNEKAGNVRIM
jgi:hypothetical protein